MLRHNTRNKLEIEISKISKYLKKVGYFSKNLTANF